MTEIDYLTLACLVWAAGAVYIAWGVTHFPPDDAQAWVEKLGPERCIIASAGALSWPAIAVAYVLSALFSALEEHLK